MEQNSKMFRIIFPHRFDVLFGKDKRAKLHTGNLRALHLVSMWQSKYEAAGNRYEKTEIAEKIVGIIHESNGRFLKRDGSGWVEVDDVAAREKISHFFRNQRPKIAKNDRDASNSKRSRTNDPPI